jgi:hypothetical protein
VKDESTDLTQSEQAAEQLRAAPKSVTESVDFWLQFPIDLRPLKFVPGRNRKEKRTFQKLASQAERGTISKGHPKGGGGNLRRLQGMLRMFQSLGIAKVAGSDGGKK